MSTLLELFGAHMAQSQGFMGLPVCRDMAKLDAKIAVFGAPGCTPYSAMGFYCARGPEALRSSAAVYAESFGQVNFDLGGPTFANGISAVDCGDLAQDVADPVTNRRRLFTIMRQILETNAIPVLLGGGGCVNIPMLQSFWGRDKFYTILHIDSHVDWSDHFRGEKFGMASTMRRASEMDHIEHIVQVGARGVGLAKPEDLRFALDWGSDIITAEEVARDGIWRAVDLIPEGSEVIVCLDVDALDPSVMPAVLARNAGGLGYWQVLELIGAVAAKARIAGLSMTELMPQRDIKGLGALTAAQMMAAILGIIDRQPLAED